MINEQSLKDRLKNISQERNVHFNTCWKQLLLERFLARLAASEHTDKFIFKGGFLLAYLIKIGRETTDLDFLLTKMKAGQEELKAIFEKIVSIHFDDGFAFSFNSIDLLLQPHMEYPGYRTVLNGRFGNMKDKIQIDVGVGDTVSPLPMQLPLVQYKGSPLFESSVSLQVYPIETIFSEKLETVLSKGAGNSRMKDYHDLLLIVRDRKKLDTEQLKKAVTSTFSNRGAILQAIEFDEASCNVLQRIWAAHCRGIGDTAKELNLPTNIVDVMKEINHFVVSLLEITNNI